MKKIRVHNEVAVMLNNKLKEVSRLNLKSIQAVICLLSLGLCLPSSGFAGKKGNEYSDAQGRIDSIDRERVVINDQSFDLSRSASFKNENGSKLSFAKLGENDEVQCKFSPEGLVEEIILLKKGSVKEDKDVSNGNSGIILREEGVWKN